MTILLKMLGADTEEQAAETLTQYMTFLSDVRAATGSEPSDPKAVLGAVKATVAFRQGIEQLTGKKGDEATAEIAAWKEGAAKCSALQSDLDRVLAAAGEKTADGAIGAIAAGKSASEALQKAQADLSSLQQEKEAAEADKLLAQLKTENRISPAQEKDLWPSLTLEGKRSFAKSAPPLGPGGAVQQEENHSNKTTATTWNGKSYTELSGREKEELKAEDPELFSAMRKAAGFGE